VAHDLSKLLNKALHEIQARADIKALGNDDESEALMDQLPYDIMAEMELHKEHNQKQVAEELLHKMQRDVDEMIAIHRGQVARLKLQLNHPLLPAKDKEKFRAKLQQNGLVMIEGFYKAMGVSEETAKALAEAQITE
jgi:hypothetical protein